MVDVVILCADEADPLVRTIVDALPEYRAMPFVVDGQARVAFGETLLIVAAWSDHAAKRDLASAYASYLSGRGRTLLVRPEGAALPAALLSSRAPVVAISGPQDSPRIRDAVASAKALAAAIAADRAHARAQEVALRRRAARGGFGAGMAAGLAMFGIGAGSVYVQETPDLDPVREFANARTAANAALTRVASALVAPAWAKSAAPAAGAIALARLEAAPMAVTPSGTFETVQTVSVSAPVVAAAVTPADPVLVGEIAERAERMLARNRGFAANAVAKIDRIASAGPLFASSAAPAPRMAAADVPLEPAPEPVRMAAADADVPLAAPMVFADASGMVSDPLTSVSFVTTNFVDSASPLE